MFKVRNNHSLEISIIISLIITFIILNSPNIIKSKIDILTENLLHKSITSAHEILELTIEESLIHAETYAEIIASSDTIVPLLKAPNIYNFCDEYSNICKMVDFITVYDRSGEIIIQTKEDYYCNNVKNCYIINDGFLYGYSLGVHQCNDIYKLYLVASRVVRDTDGKSIALVTCGYDLSNIKYINSIKDKTSCEIIIFKDAEIINTTFKNKNLIGAKMLPDVYQKIFDNKEIVIERMELFNNQYIACYSPIISDKQVIGSLFVGINIDKETIEIEQTVNTIKTILIIVGILSIISIFILNIITLSKPINEFNKFIENLSKQDNLK